MMTISSGCALACLTIASAILDSRKYWFSMKMKRVAQPISLR